MSLNINIICKQKKKEEKYIKPFVEFYLPAYFPSVKDVDICCPDVCCIDKNNKENAPDYFLKQQKIAIEIKEVHSEEETKHSKLREYSVKRLQEELDKITKNLKSLKKKLIILFILGI